MIRCDGCGNEANQRDGDVFKFLAVWKPGGRKSGKSKVLNYHVPCAPEPFRSLVS